MTTPSDRTAVALAAGLALALVVAFHATVGDVGLSLADEGYLWYGVQRTVAGEVPLRDFQAYDPGRYWWCAAFAPFLGDGIMAVRLAAGLFLAVGLTLAFLVLRRASGWPLAWVPLGVLLFLWCFPRHKIFEHAIVMAAVWSATRLVERPSVRRHFESGVYLGLAGVMGRNHALYGAVVFGVLFVWLALRHRGEDWKRRLLAAVGGGLVGYAPILVAFLVVPGFLDAQLESIELILKHGANLPRPYPWPDPAAWAELSGAALFARLGHDLGFLLPLLIVPVGLVVALRTRREDLPGRAAIVATSLVGAVYFHHVHVRSDPPHLAQMIAPVLILGCALPGLLPGRAGALARPVTWLLLGLVTVGMTLESHTTLQRWGPEGDARLEAFEAGDDVLRLPPGQARYLGAIRSAVRANLAPEDRLFIAPTRPTLYPLLGKRAPLWWIYFFWKAEPEEERVLIEQLRERGVDWVLLADLAIDDREDQRFAVTNPLLDAHLQEEFRVVARPAPRHFLMRRKER